METTTSNQPNNPENPYQQTEILSESQAVENLKNSVSEMDKAIQGANGVVIFIAALNMLLGVVFTFFPNIISGDGAFSGFVGGVYYIIPALLFLGLSFGVVRRSRACLLFATIFMTLDAIITLVDSGLGDGIAFSVMRIIFIISLFTGTRFCFKYHSTVKKHAAESGLDRKGLLKACKPKIKKWQIIVCSIFAVIGIGTAAYGIAGGVYVEGRNFEDWVEYSSGPVTVRMPSSIIWEESEDIIDLPGTKYITAYSETRAGNVILIRYQGVLSSLGYTAENASGLEYDVLSELIIGMGATVIDNYEGVFPGGVRYIEVLIEVLHEFGVIRSFSIGDDIFITGIFLEIEKDREFIDLFYASIRIE